PPGPAGRVVAAARTAAATVLRPLRWMFGAHGGGAAAQPAPPVSAVPSALIGRYGRWLTVKPITNSRLIEVSFTSPSPGLSQRVANAHARGYILQNLESKFQLTGEARDFLEKEIDRVQRALAQAERALRASGRQSAAVEGARIGSEAEYRLVENREGDSLPSVLTNQLIQGLKQEVSRLEVRHAEQAEVFLPASPQMKEIDAQLKQAKGRLAREVARAVGGVQSAYLAARAREQNLREQFQLQQDAVLNLKDISGQYIKLDQAVTTTRNPHGTLLQRLEETDVVKGVQLSNATVVDPAERAARASHPAVPFNLAFGLLFGGGLGLGLVFALENIDSSLQTP